MLAKINRLTGSENFRKVEKEGRVFQSESFGIAILKREGGAPSRYAFIVSTKISKDAADRNRFKRTISEAVRLSTIDLVGGYDVVFLAKTSIIRVPTSELMKEVKRALVTTGLALG